MSVGEMSLICSIVGRTHAEAAAWNEFVLSVPEATGYHLIEWRRVIEESFGHPTYYLTAKTPDGSVRGVLPMVLLASRIFGRFLVSLPFVNYGGLLADSTERREQLQEAAIKQAQALDAEHIELREQEVISSSWVSSPRKVSMRLMLPGSYEELWKGFPSKLRSQVRRAQKEGMVTRIGGSECLNDFYDVFSRCMRDLGTPVYGKDFFAKILDVFPKEACICLVAYEGKPVAAGFLYGFRSTLEIPWAASDKRFNKLAPNMLLYSTVLDHACQQGFHVFDFGRSTPDSGTYRFKEQWGAKPKQLHWYYWLNTGRQMPQLNPQNPRYALAIRMWQCMPLWLTNALGPGIVKYLP